MLSSSFAPHTLDPQGGLKNTPKFCPTNVAGLRALPGVPLSGAAQPEQILGRQLGGTPGMDQMEPLVQQ